MIDRRRMLLAVGATAVLVSGYIHFYLYFRGGYRGISPQRLLGIDISRSFTFNAIASVIIAELLVLSLRFPSLRRPAAGAGIAFALGALGAYLLSRTTGLLGFTEHTTTTEAIIAKLAELGAVASLTASLLVRNAARSEDSPATRTPLEPSRDAAAVHSPLKGTSADP